MCFFLCGRTLMQSKKNIEFKNNFQILMRLKLVKNDLNFKGESYLPILSTTFN